jgi:hypothetical protein
LVPELPVIGQKPKLPGTEGMQAGIVVPIAINKALSELLNQKHLYQSVHIKWKEVESQISQNNLVGESWRRQGYEMLHRNPWCFKQDLSTLGDSALPIELPLVSTFCGNCQ